MTNYPNPAALALLRVLGPYLAHQIDVWVPSRNRLARLHGLPYCLSHERPAADVCLYRTETEREESELFVEVEELPGPLLPVLYDPADRVRVIAAHERSSRYTEVLRLSFDELHRMARLVDLSRELGIAIGLRPDQYKRKEVGRD